MLEWLQLTKLAAGQSDHQCYFLSSLNNSMRQIVCDLCQGFVGNTEASSSNCASPRHVWICRAPPIFFFCKVSTWKHEIVWKPFASQGLHGEKPHRAELCKNVWCGFLSWAYATFCFREAVFVWWPFSQSCNSLAMGRKGWSGTAAVQPSVSHMTCMTWLKTQGKQKTYQQCCPLYLVLCTVQSRVSQNKHVIHVVH